MFDSIILLRFGGTKAAIEKFDDAKKKTIKRWDVNVVNIVISKLDWIFR